jgi:hypothetical protein
VTGLSASQAIIAAMLTPALLILASASLIATALVRLARVVDRVRALAAGSAGAGDELARHERRARFALRAVTAYFWAVALFVAAGASIALDRALDDRLTWLPVTLTLAGMVLIVLGAGAMAVESGDSAVLIAADIARIRGRAPAAGPGSPPAE